MEKKKKYIRLMYKTSILLVLPILYYFILSGFNTGSTTEPETSVNIQGAQYAPVPNSKNFVNAIFNGGIWDWRPGDWIETHLANSNYNELNFNTVHLYDYINGDTNGTPYYGKFAEPLTSQQIINTNGLLNLTENKNLEILLDRSKISKLCYAQRLIYEVSAGNTTENNGFCYSSTGGSYTTDQGRTVLYASDPNQSFPNGYWLARNVYENLQHSDLYSFNAQLADSGTWHIKPMMRIDSSIVDNYPEKPVVRIVVNNFRGDSIKTVIIKARNFARKNLNTGEYVYNGSYNDVFEFLEEPFGTNLQVSGSKTNSNGLGYGVDNVWFPYWNDNCHIDFKVYWMGEVPVWFDKMTVDDKWANELFEGNLDFHIVSETTPQIFVLTAARVKDKLFNETNYPAVNYVMNIMYDKLQFQAMPITLKNP